jgi:hypothetical protein
MSNKYSKQRSQLMRPKVCKSLPPVTQIPIPDEIDWEAISDAPFPQPGRCHARVTVFFGIAIQLFFDGVPAACGMFGTDQPTHILSFRFDCASTAFAVRDAVIDKHAERQAAQDYCLGEGPWPLNATISDHVAPECACTQPEGAPPWKQTVTIQSSPPGFDHPEGAWLWDYLGFAP